MTKIFRTFSNSLKTASSFEKIGFTLSFGTIALGLAFGCASFNKGPQSAETADRQIAADTGEKLGCEEVIDFSKGQFKGRTYLDVMQAVIKPKLDEFATEGYEAVDGETLVKALDAVSPKVKKQILMAAGSESSLRMVGDKLSGKAVNLYNLPLEISKAARVKDRYKLSTFVGLASCGGVVTKFFTKNFAYNVHYGTGSQPRDNQTGRSFGAGPTRDAEDASDKAYLTDLEEFVKHNPDSSEFYRTLLQALTSSDTSNFKKVSEFGQTLLSDFLAVYTAEQARNLMDNRITLHWDAALLEVTLLGAFHGGQDKITLYFDNPNSKKIEFTDQVVNQAPGGEERTRVRDAALIDYWQFSSNPAPESRNRSGINITRDEFRLLGKKISEYQRAKNPELVANVERHLKDSAGENIFESLSRFLINPKTKRSLGNTGYDLTEDFTAFLAQVRKDAKAMTKAFKASR